ncbi:MAG: thioredoxin family protein, partial [Acidimicrobiia bacterium]
PEPATYQVTIETEQWGELGPIGLVSSDDPVIVVLGDEAPQSNTRTSADHPLEQITSDPDPNPRFYEMSVAEAVSSGPSVIVFATPAWCSSQTCGPLLDQVGELSADYPGLNFVHVEIYEDIHVDSTDQLKAVPAVVDWGLPSEPWVFVTNGEGVVTRAFEGAASDTELRAAFDEVSR